ncbi:MAG: prolyl oligopeptidase family serine peptidase [Terriglobales bacterium]
MRGRVLLFIFLSLFIMMQIVIAQDKQGSPITRRDDVKETIHGVTVEDPYRWLEDQNSPETREWIDTENKYTQSLIGSLPTRPVIDKRLGQLLKVDNYKEAFERNGRYFYAERNADQDQFVLLTRKTATSAPEVLVDPHPLSPDHSTSVNFADVSEDGTLLAYEIRKGGADETEIHFMDVNTRKELVDHLPAARYFNVQIVPDKSGFYYDIMTDQGPRVRWHKMGTDPAGDVEIFGKAYGPEKIIISELSEDGRWLLSTVMYGSSADKTEVFYLDRNANDGAMKPLIHDIDARFFVRIGGDHVFVHTNWRAPNGRVMDIDLKHPDRPHWFQIIPEQQDAVIESLHVAGGKVAITYLKNVASHINFFTPNGQPAGEVSFPAMGTVGEFSGRWGGREAFFDFSSFHIPKTIYRYNTATKAKTVFARVNAPVKSSELELKQVWYESKDKTKVPMFILAKKGVELNGANPTYLTAYGGFTVSMTPQFSAIAVLWAENGGLFAVPNLRGGGEFGENWHKAGMMEHKQNVFDDFIAAAEYLIDNKYTSSQKLAIAGGSNGGLLVGAAETQRPDLYKAVVCKYPLLDMIRYQNFLVAKFWVPEYGSSENADQFQYLMKYSPYHNVHKDTKYPATLFITGDADTRVAPLHARKMAALMQWAQGGDAPILLHYDTKAGHSEGRSVKKLIEDATDEVSFVWWQLGVTPTETRAVATTPNSKLRKPRQKQK